MADTATLTDAIMARLKATAPAGLTVFDGEPPSTPTGRYVVVTTNVGTARPDRLAQAGGSRDLRWLLTCKTVGRTRPGVRAATDWLRATITDATPTDGPSTGPLLELGGSDMLTDGPEGDRRHSQTLIWGTNTDPRQED